MFLLPSAIRVIGVAYIVAVSTVHLVADGFVLVHLPTVIGVPGGGGDGVGDGGNGDGGGGGGDGDGEGVTQGHIGFPHLGHGCAI